MLVIVESTSTLPASIAADIVVVLALPIWLVKFITPIPTSPASFDAAFDTAVLLSAESISRV